MNVKNADLREEIYRSKLTYTDLPRIEQRQIAAPSLYVDTITEIPAGFGGVVKISDGSYLPPDFKTPFAPFQLWRDGTVVARAFWKGSEPSLHGRLTDRLGLLIMTLVKNYARKPNFSSYSYIDDMIAQAVVDAMAPALKFDERRTSNPFAFLTTNTYFSFCKFIKREKEIARHRHQMVEEAYEECVWSSWNAEQAEADNSNAAMFDDLCARLDALLAQELNLRRGGVFRSPNYIVPATKERIKITPAHSAAIKYGLKIGLSGSQVAAYFNLDTAVVSRVRNAKDPM